MVKQKVLPQLKEAQAETYKPRQGYPECPRKCAAGCQTCFGKASARVLAVLEFYFDE